MRLLGVGGFFPTLVRGGVRLGRGLRWEIILNYLLLLRATRSEERSKADQDCARAEHPDELASIHW